jgi:pimeloyl-ACP methyl ester carboxylesterase
MVGWHLLLLLVIEIAVYGAAGRYAHAAHGWSVYCSMGLALAIYVGVRIVLVGAEFLIARWKGGPIPDAMRVSPARLLGMYVRELGGWMLMFTFVMPFLLSRRSVLDRRPGAPSGSPPLLLIHGLGCNRGNWFWLRRRLQAQGYRVFTVDCTPPLTRIANYAPQISRAVDEILGATDAKRLVLIGHSMGGLVARAYLDEFGADKVAHVITLGTPHRGTWMTKLGVSPAVRDMAEDSPWLAGLREREAARAAHPYAQYTCIYTHHDNLVTPQTNALLPGAQAIALSGIGHLSLALSSAVAVQVLRALGRLRKET